MEYFKADKEFLKLITQPSNQYGVEIVIGKHLNYSDFYSISAFIDYLIKKSTKNLKVKVFTNSIKRINELFNFKLENTIDNQLGSKYKLVINYNSKNDTELESKIDYEYDENSVSFMISTLRGRISSNDIVLKELSLQRDMYITFGVESRDEMIALLEGNKDYDIGRVYSFTTKPDINFSNFINIYEPNLLIKVIYSMLYGEIDYITGKLYSSGIYSLNREINKNSKEELMSIITSVISKSMDLTQITKNIYKYQDDADNQIKSILYRNIQVSNGIIYSFVTKEEIEKIYGSTLNADYGTYIPFNDTNNYKAGIVFWCIEKNRVIALVENNKDIKNKINDENFIMGDDITYLYNIPKDLKGSISYMTDLFNTSNFNLNNSYNHDIISSGVDNKDNNSSGLIIPPPIH